MKVIEIFESIQGEGTFLGMPAIFVRLGGCNLHCPFCDTKNSWGDQGVEKETQCEICNGRRWRYDGENDSPRRQTRHRRPFPLRRIPSPIVVITGGEPSINEDLIPLAKMLKQGGKKVHLETNGTHDVDHTYFDWIVCSPKKETRFRVCCTADELKYVVTPEFSPERDIASSTISAYGNGHIWLQPEGSDMQNMWHKAVELVKQFPELRIGVQLHKLMEVR